MPLDWKADIDVEGEKTTPAAWLVKNFREYTSLQAANILSNFGVGTIGESGVQRHLKTHHGLGYGQGRRVTTNKSTANGQDPMFQGIRAVDILKFLRKSKTVSLSQLSRKFDRSESTIERILSDMITSGYAIKRELKRVTLLPFPEMDFKVKPLFPHGKTVEICFGLVSDTHAGSYCEQVTALNDFVHIAHEEYGVQHMIHGGDAFAGVGVYRGQEAELYAETGWAQINAVADNLPRYKDLTWYVLGGNHDYSYIKAGGPDVRRGLVDYRDDIVLLDYDAHTLPLLKGIDAQLWHPSGGMPYALSYRGQKGVEQLAYSELMAIVMGDKKLPTVRLLFIGHLHAMYHFEAGPIAVVGAGCFEGRNSYIKRKGLVPHIGGWILQCQFVDGMLHRLTPIRIRYREIEDDWKPYHQKRQAKNRQTTALEPIFTLAEKTGKRAKR